VIAAHALDRDDVTRIEGCDGMQEAVLLWVILLREGALRAARGPEVAR